MLPLPEYDNLTYKDLVEEALALMPGYDPSWTNHNPSDPGITLIELFAWLAEMLVYRSNRISDTQKIVFLKLLRGPEWKPGADLEEDIRTTILGLRAHDRAVTCEDWEMLAREASADVARAKCVPERNLDAGSEEGRKKTAPGHISLIIVPRSLRASRVALPMAPQPGEGLIKTVKDYLEPRRLLTTRHHVTGPIYTPVGAEILIARQGDAEDKDLRSRIVAELTAFLDSLIGGPDQKGWPFGRDIYISELYDLLERVPGVNYVPDIFVYSQCPPGEPDGIPAKPIWHEGGELIGLNLEAHHLPVSQILPETVITSAKFVGVQVNAEVNRIPSAAPKDVNRAVKMAVRKVFHPLHGGPDGQGEREITLEDITQALSKLSEIQALVGIELRSDPAHEIINAQEKLAAVCLRKRELVDLLVTVKITP